MPGGSRRPGVRRLLAAARRARPRSATTSAQEAGQVDSKIATLQAALAVQQQRRGGAARPDRRLHVADPRARGAGRRRLAAPADARARPRAPPASASTRSTQLFAPPDEALRASSTQQYRLVGRDARTAARRHLRVRPGARRSTSFLGSSIAPGGARPGRTYLNEIGEQDRRIAHEVAHAKRAVTARAREDQEAPQRPSTARRAVIAARDRADARRARRARRRDERPRSLDEAAEADRPLAADAAGAAPRPSEIDALQAASSAALGARSAPRRRRTVRPDVDAVVGRPDLAGQRPDHEPVRLALGPHAPGDRHRRLVRARRSTPPPRAPSSTAAGRRATATSTVIDHGGNLATAYGHQSSIAVTLRRST